jgi:tRNA/tmRNA/rRNA uracil-C5-methylase (TrmA/RlmC/RlmD family)
VVLDVGPVAHGGHCVARLDGPHGRVVFVRHALPGERVRAVITEDASGSFWRADAVEVLSASPERVEAPCRYAGPGRCGGCDWQHATPAYQRALKAAVVAEQLQRLAGLTIDVTVEEIPGGTLGWRRRVDYVADQRGRLGLRRHRSHSVQPVDGCLIGAPGVGDAPVLDRRWPAGTAVSVAAGDDARTSVLVTRPAASPRPNRGRRRPAPAAPPQLRSGPTQLSYTVDGHRFRVAAGGFWQPHVQAATSLTAAVLAAAAPRPGETVLDLYAGSGLFTAALADAVGATGWVVGVEGSSRAVRDAGSNLAASPWAEVRARAVTADAVAGLPKADLVVLDPPRTGAGRDVITAVLDRAARGVVYVACDPAALARDVRTALDAGWRIGGLRAFDAFPMTHHVECVCLLVPPATAGADDAVPAGADDAVPAGADEEVSRGRDDTPPVSSTVS